MNFRLHLHSFQIETAIKDKEAEFKSLREELALTKSASERLQEELNSAECRNKELEEAIVTLKQEMESMSKARKRQISTDESNSASNKVDIHLFFIEHVLL